MFIKYAKIHLNVCDLEHLLKDKSMVKIPARSYCWQMVFKWLTPQKWRDWRTLEKALGFSRGYVKSSTYGWCNGSITQITIQNGFFIPINGFYSSGPKSCQRAWTEENRSNCDQCHPSVTGRFVQPSSVNFSPAHAKLWLKYLSVNPKWICQLKIVVQHLKRFQLLRIK
jgi:hypothetical protein